MIPLKKLIEREPAANVFSSQGRDYAVDAREHDVGGKKYAEFDFYKQNVLKLRVFVNREGELKKWSVADRAERTADIDKCLFEGYYWGQRISKLYTDAARKISERYFYGGDITVELDNLNARRRNKAFSRKCMKEESLKAEYFSQIPEFVATEELIGRIRRQVISERFLFKWNEKFRDPMTNLPYTESLGFCTCCGVTMRLGRGLYRHNDKTACEECGASVTVKDIKRSHTSLTRSGCFQVIQKLSENCVMLSTFICHVDCRNLEYGRVFVPELQVFEGTRQVFDAARGIYRRYEMGYGSWVRRERFSHNESYDYGMVNKACFWSAPREEKIYNGVWLFLDASQDALENTRLKYLDWRKVLSSSWDMEDHGNALNVRGLGLWIVLEHYFKHPVYEMFAKVGAYKLFASRPRELEEHGIDLSKKTFAEMFGVAPKRARVLLSANPSVSALRAGLSLVEQSPTVDTELIKTLFPFLGRGDNNYKRIKHLSLLPEKAKKYNYDMEIYRDYISDCVRLGWDLSDKYIEFPKDVVKAHADAQVQISVKDNKKYETQIKKRAKECAEYGAERDGLIIRPAQSVEDLIREGTMQNNCVARNYTGSYASGNCIIMFVRKKEDPDKSYITVEIKDGAVVQSRIKGNLLPDEEGKAFLKWYEEAVLRKINNKKKKVRKAV